MLTEFRGRGDEIRVYPLLFSEYLSAYDGTEEDAWLEYMTYGGLPRILSMQTDEQKSKYLTDLGLRNARLGFRQIEETHLMENVIYNELKRRGFNVDVGLIEIREDIDGKRVRKQLEVDFIAYKGNNKYYIQSAFSIPDEEKKRQEERPLLNIPDSFKKTV